MENKEENSKAQRKRFKQDLGTTKKKASAIGRDFVLVMRKPQVAIRANVYKGFVGMCKKLQNNLLTHEKKRSRLDTRFREAGMVCGIGGREVAAGGPVLGAKKNS